MDDGQYVVLALKELERLEAGERFYRMFPAEGPFAREKYGKQIEFFHLGAKKPFRCLLGGNGCITPWTRIETPVGSVPVVEFLGCEGFAVRSWADGSKCDAQASGVFLKELSPAFRVHLDNGQWFDCSHKHRVLTHVGWLAVDQLIHASGGLRYWRKHEDCLASCVSGDRLRGARLRAAKGIALNAPPSRGDVHQRVLSAVSQGDAAEHTPQRIHVYPGSVRLSSRLYDPIQVADLCARYQDPSPILDEQWCSQTRRDIRQSALASYLTGSVALAVPDRYRSTANAFACAHEGHSAEDSGEGSFRSYRETELSAQLIRPGQWPIESLDGEAGEWIFFPSEHQLLIGGNRIVSVIPLGIQPILDFTVDGTSCYEAAGIIHHNTGKTVCGAFETTCHLTGEYPDWWAGKRFNRPVRVWVAGVDFKSIRESLQVKLIGARGSEGTGMIPRDKLEGLPHYNQHDCVDFFAVKHISGGTSRCVIKCYEQGRESFQAADVDFIWLDEEPDDAGIYTECVQRFRGDTKGGHVILTFTPLFGVSDVICMFLPAFMQSFDEAEYERSGRAFVNCTLDDVPHISPEEKAQKIANTMPHEREARINGVPSIGEGKIYPFAEESFVIDPIAGGLPRHWPRLYGLDPGKTCTAAVWGAHDRDDDIIYLYSEHYMKDQLPPVHAQAIKARGHWIPGVIDPASKVGSALVDYSVLEAYTNPKFNLGLRLKMHQHRKGMDGRTSVESGILAVYERLSTGRLKVYRTLSNWLTEFRQYSRDKNQKVIKRNDHLMDASRYLCQNMEMAMLPHDMGTKKVPKLPEETFGVYCT